MLNRFHFFLFCSITMMPACQRPPISSANDLEPTYRAMQAVYDAFTAAYKQADLSAVASLYTEDAYYLEPGRPIFSGRDSIKANFSPFLSRFEPGKGPNITFEIIERQLSGRQGYDIGYYLFDGKRSGKFIVLWQQLPNGEWKIRADGYSYLNP